MPPIYDRFARFYDSAFAPLERRFLSVWRAETLSLIPPNTRLLEIGCGTGANFIYYPKCDHAVSSELSFNMLERAKEKATVQELIQADAEKLPFAENSFDAAFATLVFCSVPDPAAGFAEIRRVVRRGGVFVLLEHVRPPGKVLGTCFDVLNIATTALIEDHFNRETAQLVENAGFELIDVRKKARGAVNIIVCRNLS